MDLMDLLVNAYGMLQPITMLEHAEYTNVQILLEAYQHLSVRLDYPHVFPMELYHIKIKLLATLQERMEFVSSLNLLLQVPLKTKVHVP